MRRIILHAPALCRHGVYRDAGAELVIGGGEQPDPERKIAYIEAERAAELIDQRRAAHIDPLDHDGNGRKGGAAKAA